MRRGASQHSLACFIYFTCSIYASSFSPAGPKTDYIMLFYSVQETSREVQAAPVQRFGPHAQGCCWRRLELRFRFHIAREILKSVWCVRWGE